MPAIARSPSARPWFTVLASALLLTSLAGTAWAENSTPVVLTFSTTGDSRQDPINFDKASVGTTLSGQDAVWLQNTKALARILRSIQAQKAGMLFFNGDMVHGYGWGAFGYTTNANQTAINGANNKATPVPDASWTSADQVNGSDIMKFQRQYGFWRGVMAPVMEAGTYVFPVAGNHEVQCKACKPGKVAKLENEQLWAANMGDLIVDSNRFASILGAAPSNISYGPAAGTSPDGLTTDQSKLSFSFDFKGVHFAVINTDAVGKDGQAPTLWLQNDLSAARGRGAKKLFVFGHKPAFTYAYLKNSATAPSGLDATSAAAANALWDVIESNQAIYFCGHEHIFNISQPRGGAYQVIVGTAGSPFDAKASDVTQAPATDRSYSWATVKVHADGGTDVQAYGFDEHFGPTTLLQQLYLP